MITKYDLLNYLHDKYDVTLKQIIEDMKITNKELLSIKIWLQELIKENWIVKSGTISGEDEYYS